MGRLLSVWPIVYPALLCALADYIGLSAITPALPYHLAANGLSADAAARWVGIISSSQFGAVILACIFWGRVCDVYGAKSALVLTMIGDSVLFSVTALARDPTLLVVLRVGAGFFSPLVPAIAYIFEQLPPQQVVEGIAWYAFAVPFGLALGSASVSLYEYIGWDGLSLLCGGIAFFALLVAVLKLKRRPDGGAGRRAKPEGVWRAMCTGDFLTTSLTAFAVGFSFNVYLQVTAVMLFDVFALTPSQASAVFLSIPVVMLLNNLLSAKVIRWMRPQLALTVFMILATLLALLIMQPAVYGRLAVFIPVMMMLICTFSIAHVANQSRPGAIGRHFTKNGTGQLAGYSRVMFAAGQAVSPAIALQLYPLGVGWAWSGILVLNVLVLLSYPLLGVHLLREPKWATAQVVAEAALPAAAKSESSDDAASTPEDTSGAE